LTRRGALRRHDVEQRDTGYHRNCCRDARVMFGAKAIPRLFDRGQVRSPASWDYRRAAPSSRSRYSGRDRKLRATQSMPQEARSGPRVVQFSCESVCGFD
jgi:hypothetical protein